jgi:hypothetical protein
MNAYFMIISRDFAINERCACIPVNFSLLSDSHFKKLGVPESYNSFLSAEITPFEPDPGGTRRREALRSIRRAVPIISRLAQAD